MLLLLSLLLLLLAAPAAAFPVRIDGPLEVFVADDFAGKKSTHVYQLGPFELRGTRAQLERFRTGDRVRVHGVTQPGPAVLQVRSIRPVGALARPRTAGDQKTLVLVAHLSDRPNTTPIQTHTDVTFNAANSVAAYYREASRQQVTLTGTVVGPYLVNVASAGCNHSAIGAALETAAKAAGVAVDSYARRIYAFPPTGCSFWGYASLGGNPSRSWINGSYAPSVVAHELGHNFGLGHSNALECGAASWCTPGQTIEYGDTVDVMGDAGRTGTLHFNATQKERLGWITVPLLVIPAGATSVDVTLQPYAAVTGTVAAKFIGTGSDMFYVENRRRAGFDLGAPVQVEQGVLVHLSRSSGGSFLLDMTETTPGFGDPALAAGRSFAIPNTPLTLEVVAAGAQAQVRLRTGAAPPIPPNPTPGGLTDDFNRPNGPLGNGWQAVTGTWAIQGNAAAVTAGSQSNRPVTVRPELVGPTQTVSAIFMRPSSASNRAGFVLRYQDPKNYLACFRQVGSPSAWTVSKVVNKVETVVAKVNADQAPIGQPFAVVCRIEGNTVSIGETEGQWALVTSSSTFATGSVGLYANKDGMKADTFRAFVGP